MPLFEKAGSKQSMTAERVEAIVGEGFDVKKFVENFEALVNAAGSVKHLKDMVAQLAVRGRLSSPTRDTADSLVAELQRARAKLAKTGIRVGDVSLPVADDEAPYPLPPGWRWLRLRDLGGFLGGGTPSKANAAFWKGTLPWVSPKDMKRPYIEDAEDHISIAAVQGSAVKLVPAQSLLYVVRGMILARSFPVAVTTREVTVNQDMKALVLALPELSEFILRSCQAARTRVLAKVERSSHGTCRLESEAVEMLPLALPPLAEQKRIVAKIDHLMALCDELEAREIKKRETGARLTKSALEALTTAEGPEEFDAAWKRVVENFDVLIDRSEKVEGLRRGILELAVRGRLVPVSRSPVEVEALEAQIAIERASMIEGRRTGGRGNGEATQVDAFTPPYELPAAWRWRPLADIAGHIVDGTHHTPKYVERGMDFISAKDVRKGKISFDGCRQISKEEFDELTKRCRPKRGDVLVTKSGSIGEVAIVDTDRAFTLFESVALVPVVGSVNSHYAAYVIYLGASGDFGAENQRGVAVRHLHLVDLRKLPFPLPPRKEQDAIVLRVEQLMKGCDELEAMLRRAEERAAKLVEAVVQELVA